MSIDDFEDKFRRILKISFVDRITNKEVLNRVQTKLHLLKDMRGKLEYVGHVMRSSSDLTFNYTGG